VANTAVPLANIVVVDSVEFVRCAVHSRYNSGHRTLSWGKAENERGIGQRKWITFNVIEFS
jgi:hypothetical protein